MSFSRLLVACGLLATGGLNSPASADDGKIHLSYWEKWSGTEQSAMQRVVDAYNHSQDRVVVDFLSIGQIEEKTLLATAGGDPPDISGVYLHDICSFADRNALTPIDSFLAGDGTTTDKFMARYAPAYAKMGLYQGSLWGVPSTTTTTALYWNKNDFRAAGLDPEVPPRTVPELMAMSARLTKRDADGNLQQVGFLPQMTGDSWALPLWFGGSLFNGHDVLIGRDPANLAAFRWVANFSKLYSVDAIRRLSSTFGTLSSPQDPFMSGQVAMIIDGVYRYNFVQQFAPGMSYGVAPWPSAVPGVDDFTVADADMLVIPRGAKHPREAWQFLKYVSNPNLAATASEQLSGVELLCFVQKKPSPLVQWSPYFETHHPNPDIKIFRRLAESPHTVTEPQMGTWDQYERQYDVAFDEVRLQLESPEEALRECQDRVAANWAWHRDSLVRRAAAKPQTTTPPISSSSQ